MSRRSSVPASRLASGTIPAPGKAHALQPSAGRCHSRQVCRPLLMKCLALALAFGSSAAACGQSSIPPRFTSSNDVPGTVAFATLLANPQWVGRVQPVKLHLPEQTIVSTWQGSWVDCEYADPTVATSVGPIYQVRIRGAFRTRTFDLYPSVEMVSCLNPPAELQLRFPVPIAISEDDIEQALGGKLVTKVIYVENPETALPYRQLCNGHQAFFDVSDLEDPVRTASRLGRPIAILRLGTRQPSDSEMSFGNGATIPLTVFPPQAARDLDQRTRQVSYRRDEASASTADGSTREPAPFRFSNPTGDANNAERRTLNLAPAQLPGTANTAAAGMPAWGNGDPCNLCPAPLAAPEQAGAEVFHRDEFLFDGGDKNFHVTVDPDWNLSGLDVEDTVAAFDTLNGKRKVVASNRVAIYAPRFAAVRKIAGLSMESLPTRLARFNDTVELDSTRGKDFSSTTLQQLQPQLHASQVRARGFREQTRGLNADNVLQPQRAEDRTRSSGHLQHTRFRGYSNSEGARLELAAVAARSWEDNLGLQVVADRRQAVITRDAAKVHEIVTIKTDDGDTQLKILKQASTIAAKCGEEVEFTISFENVGDRKVGNITIIDNLTTRLEYVPDSAECSVPANFSSERNVADSLILRWEIEQPLDVGQSGLIRFKCRVR